MVTMKDVLLELMREKDDGTPGVNLDGETDPSWLRAFWLATVFKGREVAQLLYPDLPDGAWSALFVVQLLGKYAEMKAAAIEQRAVGAPADALLCEEVCDTLYKQLPAWAKTR